LPEAGIEALVKACKYSLPPNALGYCGPAGTAEKFAEFISCPSKEKEPEIRQLLQEFNSLFPYLELIASSNDLQPFDLEVVEAYWIGNSLLENVPKRDLQKTVLGLQRFGLPRDIAEQKAASVPQGAVPHHSFHVLHVNFVNPKLKPLVQNLSNCLVQWAEVKQSKGESLLVKGIELFSESWQLKLREKVKNVENPFEIEAKKGSFVSVHWGKAIDVLGEDSAAQLKAFTLKNLNNHSLLG